MKNRLEWPVWAGDLKTLTLTLSLGERELNWLAIGERGFDWPDPHCGPLPQVGEGV